MIKELNAYTTISNNILWLAEHSITSREAREALEHVMVDINKMSAGEKKNILIEKAEALNAML